MLLTSMLLDLELLFIYEGFYKYDLVQEDDFDSNSVMAVDFDTIDIPHSPLKFLYNVTCLHFDYKRIMMTSTTGLYPSLNRSKVFGDQETSFLYQSSTHIMLYLTSTSMLFAKSSISILCFIPFSSQNLDQETGGATGLLY